MRVQGSYLVSDRTIVGGDEEAGPPTLDVEHGPFSEKCELLIMGDPPTEAELLTEYEWTPKDAFTSAIGSHLTENVPDGKIGRLKSTIRVKVVDGKWKKWPPGTGLPEKGTFEAEIPDTARLWFEISDEQ